MVQKKEGSGVVSTANGGAASEKTGVEVPQRKSKGKETYWDFLDDIEAPMWVDLTQECQFTYHDRDDKWFNTSHPFHHCSSKQLISAFTSTSEGGTYLDLSVQEQYSPKLPCSVSRSRGKDYRSREWGQTNAKVTFDVQHSVKNLKNKSLTAISVADKVSSNQTSPGRRLGLASLQSDSIDERNVSEIDAQHDQSVLPFVDHKLLSSSASFGGAESNLTSISTSENGEHEHKSFEVSSQVSVQTSRFLSALKISLRKSCVTRQASRVQVTERQSGGQNSPSSKSGVGSSLAHSCDRKDPTVRENKGKTLGSIFVEKVTKDTSDGIHAAKFSSASNPKLRSQSSALPSFKQQKNQGKVQPQSVHAKVLVPRSVNEHSSAAATMKGKEKAAAATSRRQIQAGAKENMSKEMVENQKSNTRVKVTRDVVQARKVITRKSPDSSGEIKLIGQKQKLSRRGEGKPGTMVQNQKACYFR